MKAESKNLEFGTCEQFFMSAKHPTRRKIAPESLIIVLSSKEEQRFKAVDEIISFHLLTARPNL